MKRVLITGAAGYLASALLRVLGARDAQIVRFARPGSRLAPVQSRFPVVDTLGDIADSSIWNTILKDAGTIFHFAGQTSASVSNRDPQADLEINVLPILRLLETCRRRDLHPALLFASTVTIAGIPRQLPVSESHPDDPLTVYDLHKLMAEHYLKYYTRQRVVSGAILRLANIYGPGPRSSSADRGILNQMIKKALDGDELTVYGAGEQVRDYVYVDDVANAFVAASDHIAQTSGRHFVIGSGKGCTISEAIHLVAARVKHRTGRQPAVKSIQPPTPQLEIETRNFVADTSAFCRATGWKPETDLVEGIDRTIDYWLAR
ncbi:MAG TPA: NAD-dependent epimerase/dehydratase family protein [Acidobacteriota bacterium]